MGNFLVELKKYVDDSYEIETGYGLQGKLIQDLQNGLVGSIKSFAVITDDCVKKLYAGDILLHLQKAGFQAKIFSFEAGEASKTRETQAVLHKLFSFLVGLLQYELSSSSDLPDGNLKGDVSCYV